MTHEELAAYDVAMSNHQTVLVFKAYEAILHRANALDFDDLLLKAVEVLHEHPEARRAWSERFRYVQVDEFQDTNAAQEQLVAPARRPRKKYLHRRRRRSIHL